ncbi:MAG: shikimate kinase [Chloroflexaceae bacterium]|nr:shikimate kinase [Chloroflexaceae bacterium]
MTNVLQGLNVYLIGMMGTGKSTVGHLLARQLNYRFFDTDVLIERITQQSISDLFATQGEPAFRRLETQVLAQLSAYTKSVIATGGGIVLQQQNWSYLHHGLIVWLDAPAELIVQRLADDQTRPLLQSADRTAKITEILTQRQHLYAEADLHAAISAQQSPQEICDRILEMIPTVLKKPQPETLN